MSDEDLKKVTQKVIELGDRKQLVTQADLPFIISDVLDSVDSNQKVSIKNYVLTHSKDLRPSVTLHICIDGELFEEHAQGDGQYDAFVNALHKIFKQKKAEFPILADYSVHIPPGGSSDALCETTITWLYKDKEFITRGLDSDQTVAAIKATEKMLNLI